MGKASKWFRSILGLKKLNPAHQPPSSSSSSSSSPKPPTKDKHRWSFVNSYREKRHQNDPVRHHQRTDSSNDAVDPNKHAIAAVAEAAVASAHAAAAVVRLTSSGRCARSSAEHGSRIGIREEEWAAVKIQAAFRGCLARARAGRAQISELSHSRTKSSQFHQSGPATPEKFEHPIRPRSTKHEQLSILRRNSSRSNGTPDDEKNDRGLTMIGLAQRRGTPFMALVSRDQVHNGRLPCTLTLQIKPTRDLAAWTSMGCRWVTDTDMALFGMGDPL